MAVAAKKIKTRQSSTFPVFGVSSVLPKTVLLNYAEVMKFFLLVRDDKKEDEATKDPPVADIAQEVAHAVEEL